MTKKSYFKIILLVLHGICLSCKNYVLNTTFSRLNIVIVKKVEKEKENIVIVPGCLK